jgi:hypothetical protein
MNNCYADYAVTNARQIAELLESHSRSRASASAEAGRRRG